VAEEGLATEKTLMTMAKMPLCSGMLTLGSVTARVTAAQQSPRKEGKHAQPGFWSSDVNLFDHFLGPCDTLHAVFMRLSQLLM
jgi:hypothetical protein